MVIKVNINYINISCCYNSLHTDSPLQKVKGNKGQDLGPGIGCNGRVVCPFVPSLPESF